MPLYPYQEEAVKSILQDLALTNDALLCVLPTGTGKSHVIAALIQYVLKDKTYCRVLMLTHRQEIINQNKNKLQEYAPNLPIGIYSAALKEKELTKRVTFASITSIYKKAYQLGRIDYIIIDEAHLVPLIKSGCYRSFIEECQKINKLVRIIGFTATPYRLDGGLLLEGNERIFTKITYELSIKKAIDDKYLSPVTTKSSSNELSITTDKITGSDFNLHEIEKSFFSKAPALVVKDIIERASICNSILIFTATIAQGFEVYLELVSLGQLSSILTGKTKVKERNKTIQDFKNTNIKFLINCAVLTTGFDAPNIDCIVLLRPTISTALYVQMVGRGMRLFPGKERCLVLDYGRNIETHGPIDNLSIKCLPAATKQQKTQKICPGCAALIIYISSICPQCGHIFMRADILTYDIKPTDMDILCGNAQIVTLFVTSCIYESYIKPMKTPSLLVTYICGRKKIKKWICIEHSGIPGQLAMSWWHYACMSNSATPITVEEALGRTKELRQPYSITIKRSDYAKYPEIVKINYA